MKMLVRILVGIIIVIVALSLSKDMIVKVSVEKGVKMVTGLELGINKFNVGIFRQIVNIGGLRLYNPKGFEDRLMLDMPEIYVDYDLGAILNGAIHLREVRLDMKELTVEKNKNGELNLNSLNVVKASKAGGQPEGQKGKVPAIKIDTLRLKIGKAVYKDYSSGGAPIIKEFVINTDETYTNIDNPYMLVGLIVERALVNTTISSLANFDLGSLQSKISSTLSTAKDVAKNANDVAKDLQNVFKNPFGGGK